MPRPPSRRPMMPVGHRAGESRAAVRDARGHVDGAGIVVGRAGRRGCRAPADDGRGSERHAIGYAPRRGHDAFARSGRPPDARMGHGAPSKSGRPADARMGQGASRRRATGADPVRSRSFFIHSIASHDRRAGRCAGRTIVADGHCTGPGEPAWRRGALDVAGPASGSPDGRSQRDHDLGRPTDHAARTGGRGLRGRCSDHDDRRINVDRRCARSCCGPS